MLVSHSTVTNIVIDETTSRADSEGYSKLTPTTTVDDSHHPLATRSPTACSFVSEIDSCFVYDYKMPLNAISHEQSANSKR